MEKGNYPFLWMVLFQSRFLSTLVGYGEILPGFFRFFFYTGFRFSFFSPFFAGEKLVDQSYYIFFLLLFHEQRRFREVDHPLSLPTLFFSLHAMEAVLLRITLFPFPFLSFYIVTPQCDRVQGGCGAGFF